MSPLEMIESLETIAGLHGVGRIDLWTTRLTGGQSREIYEAPAAVVLHAAHRELEQLVIPSDLEQVAHALGRTYADLINNGQWFSPTRTAIDAFVAADPASRHRRHSAQAVQRRLPGRRPSLAVRAAGDTAGVIVTPPPTRTIWTADQRRTSPLTRRALISGTPLVWTV